MLARVDHELSEDTEHGHRPLGAPGDHPAWLMGLRLALAVGASALVARLLGYGTPSWAIITAAYIATNPPAESLRTALSDLAAAVLGILFGLAAAWTFPAGEAVPVWHFVLIAFVGGACATRHPAFVYTVVVGTVVAFSAGEGAETPIEVALDCAALILIAVVLAPGVVWALEWVRSRVRR